MLTDYNKLKIFTINPGWTGGTMDFFEDAIRSLGAQHKSFRLRGVKFYKDKFIPKRLLDIEYSKKLLVKFYKKSLNENIRSEINSFNPDIFFVQNEAELLPETMEYIKSKNIITMNINGDYAFDTYRFNYFPILLKYFDFVFYQEKIWKSNYQIIAPNTIFIKTVGAYSEKYFRPLPKEELMKNLELLADISFAGTSYGFAAQGHYRTEIINHLCDYGLKIWGGDGWERYFDIYPKFVNAYQKKHLDFAELNILYQNTKINLNISNPQCITAFQQRTFEMAAANAFQIADYKEEIYDYFEEDEIVTFKTIDELIDKVKYFLRK